MKYLVIILFLCFSTTLWSSEETTYGWDMPNTPLNIGGYLDMTYNEARKEKFLFDDIAIILSANSGRFDLLGELEFYNISLDGKSNDSSDVDMIAERLELTYALTDDSSLKIGRFNSDIGYWNKAPILILEDTTTKPHLLGKLFPRATTGLHYEQNLNQTYSFSFSFQDNADLAHKDGIESITKHNALACKAEYDEFSLRFATGTFENSNNFKATYIGIASQYETDDFNIQAEFFKQHSNNINKKPYSGYLQSTWYVKKHQGIVVRAETYKDNALSIDEEIYLLGYFYRPKTNMVLKGEYVKHSELPLNYFVYSLSVLF